MPAPLPEIVPLLMIPPETSAPLVISIAVLAAVITPVKLLVIVTPVIIPETETAVGPTFLIVPELVSVALVPMIETVGSAVVPAESVKVAWTLPVSFASRVWFTAVLALMSKSAAAAGSETATRAVVPKKNARVARPASITQHPVPFEPSKPPTAITARSASA